MQMKNTDRVLCEIARERDRQVGQEGWTEAHDDSHAGGEMAQAAGCYALNAGLSEAARMPLGYAPRDWPWDAKWWKPSTPRRDLVKAAALIVAEIERLDRAAAMSASQ